jgi:hypothetical protein
VSFNHHQLIARIGNEQGAREEFARLTAALAELTTRVRRIRENPGDLGIDAFAGRLDDGGEVAVWQAKFFINGVGDAQQQQIRDSFRTPPLSSASSSWPRRPRMPLRRIKLPAASRVTSSSSTSTTSSIAIFSTTPSTPDARDTRASCIFRRYVPAQTPTKSLGYALPNAG